MRWSSGIDGVRAGRWDESRALTAEEEGVRSRL